MTRREGVTNGIFECLYHGSSFDDDIRTDPHDHMLQDDITNENSCNDGHNNGQCYPAAAAIPQAGSSQPQSEPQTIDACRKQRNETIHMRTSQAVQPE